MRELPTSSDICIIVLALLHALKLNATDIFLLLSVLFISTYIFIFVYFLSRYFSFFACLSLFVFLPIFLYIFIIS